VRKNDGLSRAFPLDQKTLDLKPESAELDPPEFGGAMYEADNLRMMSALQYALSSEVTW